LGAVSYSPSIVTMALSCIVSKIKRDHTPCIRSPEGSRQNIAIPFGTAGQTRMVGLPGSE